MYVRCDAVVKGNITQKTCRVLKKPNNMTVCMAVQRLFLCDTYFTIRPSYTELSRRSGFAIVVHVTFRNDPVVRGDGRFKKSKTANTFPRDIDPVTKRRETLVRSMTRAETTRHLSVADCRLVTEPDGFRAHLLRLLCITLFFFSADFSKTATVDRLCTAVRVTRQTIGAVVPSIPTLGFRT